MRAADAGNTQTACGHCSASWAAAGPLHIERGSDARGWCLPPTLSTASWLSSSHPHTRLSSRIASTSCCGWGPGASTGLEARPLPLAPAGGPAPGAACASRGRGWVRAWCTDSHSRPSRGLLPRQQPHAASGGHSAPGGCQSAAHIWQQLAARRTRTQPTAGRCCAAYIWLQLAARSAHTQPTAGCRGCLRAAFEGFPAGQEGTRVGPRAAVWWLLQLQPIYRRQGDAVAAVVCSHRC